MLIMPETVHIIVDFQQGLYTRNGQQAVKMDAWLAVVLCMAYTFWVEISGLVGLLVTYQYIVLHGIHLYVF